MLVNRNSIILPKIVEGVRKYLIREKNYRIDETKSTVKIWLYVLNVDESLFKLIVQFLDENADLYPNTRYPFPFADNQDDNLRIFKYGIRNPISRVLIEFSTKWELN